MPDHVDAPDLTPAAAGLDRVPPTPDTAHTVFRDRLDVAEQYVALLATTGIDHGLVGPREAPRLWDRHVLGCGVMAGELATGSTLADIGSGAGLPGLVLALTRPDIGVTLVEPLHRRIVWLERAVSELGLDNVHLHEGRAESLWGASTYDVVTARAVARIGVLSQWCLPLVAPHGRLLAIKGRSAQDELAEDAALVTAAGGVSVRVLTLGDDVLEVPTTLAEVTVGATTPRPARGGSPKPGRRRSGPPRASGPRRR